MNKEKYNGWVNRNTWAFNLHISNNEGDYNYWNERARDLKDAYELAKEMKEWYNEVFEMVIEGENATKEAKWLIRDCGNGENIDFTEVAESWIRDIKEEK